MTHRQLLGWITIFLIICTAIYFWFMEHPHVVVYDPAVTINETEER